ncbi:MAG: SET domain-containing protein [Polyangiales bacterium]
MIHPDTELARVDEHVGLGVFATKRIPRGTITYVCDALEVLIASNDKRLRDPLLNGQIEKYSYTDAAGTRVLSWDHAKYVNHCCACNTMSTGYGFEIAIRDIEAGEEITDEYGMFNLDIPMACQCQKSGCRGQVKKDDLLHNFQPWDEIVRAAIAEIPNVAQPLRALLEEHTEQGLSTYLRTGDDYRSVIELLRHDEGGSIYRTRKTASGRRSSLRSR